MKQKIFNVLFLNEGKIIYAGEIDITDELKTITLRRKKDANVSVRVYNFLFEKINNTN